jgi:hypothetical protein
MPSREDGPSAVRATTEADGRFHFTVKRSDLAASGSAGTRDSGPVIAAFANGHGPAWSTDLKIGDPDGLVLRLPADEIPVIGRLIDLEGRPANGITVRVLQLDARPEGDLSRWLEDVARGLPGRLAFNDFSRPLEASLASLIPPTTTGLDGRFRLTGLGRERVVSLLIRGPRTATQVFNVMTRRGPSASIRFSDPTANGLVNSENVIHPADFEGVAAPSRPVEGVVRDRDTGLPLQGVVVRSRFVIGKPFPVVLNLLTDWPGTFIRTRTDAQGHYRLEGLPTREAVALQADPADGQPYHPASREVASTPGTGATRLDFALTRGVLVQGRVTDRATGRSVLASVEYHPTVENENGGVTQDRDRAEASLTDADGRFAVVALPGPGLVTATALGDRFLHADLVSRGESGGREPFPDVNGVASPSRCHAFTAIAPGAGADAIVCDLALTPGPEPIVTILGPDGRPIAGARASGIPPADIAREGWWQSREKARFLVTGLTGRRIRVMLFQHEHRRLAGSLAVRDSEPGPLVVRLRPWGTVSGRLIDNNGRPRPGVVLSCHGPSSANRSANHIPHDVTTDGEGRFSLEGLVPGQEYGLKVAASDGPDSRVGDLHSLEPGEAKALGDVQEQRP